MPFNITAASSRELALDLGYEAPQVFDQLGGRGEFSVLGFLERGAAGGEQRREPGYVFHAPRLPHEPLTETTTLPLAFLRES